MAVIILGKVIKGNKKGKKLGFPTVNIELNENIESGVYAGVVDIDGGKFKAGIFVSSNKKLLEAHIIGFSGDLYGKEIEIEIGKRMRSVMKFEGDKELKAQINKDIQEIYNL
jgi:riboflavin kinase / FMN adenylyltransferase